jgi:hypothetical protein
MFMAVTCMHEDAGHKSNSFQTEIIFSFYRRENGSGE